MGPWQERCNVARVKGCLRTAEKKEESGQEWRLQLAFPKRRQRRRRGEPNCPQAAKKRNKERGRKKWRRETECKQEANKWNLIIKSNASSETGQKHSTNLTKSSEIKQNKVKQNEKRNKNENETKRGGTRQKTKTFKYPINV